MRLLISVCLLVAMRVAAQGPIDGYLKGEGELDLALSVSASGADVFIDGQGEELSEFPFRGQLLSAFVAYGATDAIDVVVSVPYVITESSSGFQDAALFVKGKLLRLPLGKEGSGESLGVLAALGVSVPLSNYEVVAAGAIGQRAKVVQPRVVAQYNRLGFFASTVLGYNYRFDELDELRLRDIQQTRPAYLPEQPKDYVTALLRIGVPTSQIYVDGWVEVQQTLGGLDFVPNVEELVQPYDVDYVQVGGTVYYSESKRFGFAVSGAAFLQGRNTSRLWRGTVTLIVKAGR